MTAATFFHCRRCQTTIRRVVAIGTMVSCECGRVLSGEQIKGKDSGKVQECDSRCLGARRHICDCPCLGENHGLKYAG